MLKRILIMAAFVAVALGVSAAPANAATPESSRQVIVAVAKPQTTVAVKKQAKVTVRAGDWLSKIAATRCGSPGKWKEIYQASRSVVGNNPNLIFPGQVLTVPCASAQVAKPLRKAPVKATRSTRTSATGWVHPLPGSTCISGWGANRGNHSHKGLDLPARSGSRIRAAHSGVVTSVTWQSGAGWYVMLDNGRYLTVYMHMRARSFLRVGQRVGAGQTIGYVGSTGNSSGPHLHFEVHTSPWHPINPAPFLRSQGVRVGC